LVRHNGYFAIKSFIINVTGKVLSTVTNFIILYREPERER